jgi:pyr_form_ly_1: formate acetyltransferase
MDSTMVSGQKKINVRNFIQKNYTLYEGDDSFLADVSQKNKKSLE